MTAGPMVNGATQVLFEGVPTYPDAGRAWDIVDKYKVRCSSSASSESLHCQRGCHCMPRREDCSMSGLARHLLELRKAWLAMRAFQRLSRLQERLRLIRKWILQVTLLYTAPTAIRALQSFGDSYVTKYSRKSLRILGTVGEPINPEAWKWYHEVIPSSSCPAAASGLLWLLRTQPLHSLFLLHMRCNVLQSPQLDKSDSTAPSISNCTIILGCCC